METHAGKILPACGQQVAKSIPLNQQLGYNAPIASFSTCGTGPTGTGKRLVFAWFVGWHAS
jgi:hypothetical protein